jgi:hypothetical protein
MPPRAQREEIYDARVAILRQLAQSEEALNKHQLEKRTKRGGARARGIRRETIYHLIDQFKERREIYVAQTETTRAGKRSEKYALTDRGLYSAAMLNPDLEGQIASRLERKFTVMQEEVVRSDVEALEQWYKIARTILTSGRAPPNSSIMIEIFANEHGRVACREVWDPWGLLRQKRQGKWRRLSDDQAKDLLAAGGGRVNIHNLTPRQKELLETWRKQ